MPLKVRAISFYTLCLELKFKAQRSSPLKRTKLGKIAVGLSRLQLLA